MITIKCGGTRTNDKTYNNKTVTPCHTTPEWKDYYDKYNTLKHFERLYLAAPHRKPTRWQKMSGDQLQGKNMEQYSRILSLPFLEYPRSEPFKPVRDMEYLVLPKRNDPVSDEELKKRLDEIRKLWACLAQQISRLVSVWALRPDALVGELYLKRHREHFSRHAPDAKTRQVG